MATIKDVAREAGVGVGTVSRYINGVEIKEINRIKVEEAISKLNFKINPIARGLKTSQTNTIGLIIPDLSDTYSTTIVRSIEKKFYEYGYNIFACDSWGNPDLEKQKVQLLVQKMVDGLILYPCREDISYLADMVDGGLPVVVVDLKTKGFACDHVLTDNAHATYMAAEWFITNRHRRIGIITGSQDFFTSRERLIGYKRALEDYSVDAPDEMIKTLGFDEASGYESMFQLMQLSIPPTAVLACNYYTTIGAVKAMYRLGIKTPEQLSFIGFDNIGLSEIVQPPLSIITQPMDEMGCRAAELLLKRLNGDSTGFPALERLKTEFILRESTKPL